MSEIDAYVPKEPALPARALRCPLRIAPAAREGPFSTSTTRSFSAFRIGIRFTSLGIEMSSGILRTEAGDRCSANETTGRTRRAARGVCKNSRHVIAVHIHLQRNGDRARMLPKAGCHDCS